jgi:hypothetical protein
MAQAGCKGAYICLHEHVHVLVFICDYVFSSFVYIHANAPMYYVRRYTFLCTKCPCIFDMHTPRLTNMQIYTHKICAYALVYMCLQIMRKLSKLVPAFVYM